MQYENERMEYKSQLTEDIYKEVIAFTNTDGGVIYIGIDDQGNVTGIDNVDETYTRLTNGIRDAIQPDVTMFVRYVLQENKVIRIEVGEGSYKPYYLKGKGLKPAGVYVRQGATSVQASPEQIRQEIASWDSAKIQKAVDEYTKAIAAKTEELNAALAKVKDLSPQELLGDKGRQLKAEADKIGESLKKLKDNMAAYAEGLKAKAAK